VNEFIVALVSGGIASLVTAGAGLYLLHAQREKLYAERRKLLAESESVEACASETVTGAALVLIRPLQERVTALEAQVASLTSERGLLIQRVARHEQRIQELSTELEQARRRIEVLEQENTRYLSILNEHGIDPDDCEDPGG
jgi:phage shock protein A